MGRKEHNFNIDPFFNYDNADNGTSHKIRARFYMTSDNLTTPSATMTTEELAKWGVQSFDMNKIGDVIDKMGNGTSFMDAFLSTYVTEIVPIMNDLKKNPVNFVDLVTHGIDFVQKGLGYTGTVAEMQDAVAYAMNLLANNDPTRPELTYNGYIDYQFAKQWDNGVRLTTGINWNHITNTANITAECVWSTIEWMISIRRRISRSANGSALCVRSSAPV